MIKRFLRWLFGKKMRLWIVIKDGEMVDIANDVAIVPADQPGDIDEVCNSVWQEALANFGAEPDPDAVLTPAEYLDTTEEQRTGDEPI